MGAPEKLGESVFNAIGNEWVLPKFSPSANALAEFATNYKGVGEVVSAAFNGKQLAVYDRHFNRLKNNYTAHSLRLIKQHT